MGKPIINVPYCHSTNDIASGFAAKGELVEGGVVITQNQKSGRGQRGSTWESEPGMNLTFSIVFQPNFIKLIQQFQLHFVISLGILDFLDNYLKDKAAIKWPNDIFYMDKKLAGILVENTVKSAKIEWSVIGIGLNVNQLKFNEKKAISMTGITGITFDLDHILEELLLAIETRYIQLKQGSVRELKSSYLSRLHWKDKPHLFRESGGTEFEGVITDIDDIGRLVLKKGKDIKNYNFKEIEFIA